MTQLMTLAAKWVLAPTAPPKVKNRVGSAWVRAAAFKIVPFEIETMPLIMLNALTGLVSAQVANSARKMLQSPRHWIVAV